MGGEMCSAKCLGKTQAARVWEEDERAREEGVKARYTLLPAWALDRAALALTLGAEKHARDDFSKKDSGRTVEGELDAVWRHIAAWRTSTNVVNRSDPETGLHHLAHAAARCLIACQLALEGRE